MGEETQNIFIQKLRPSLIKERERRQEKALTTREDKSWVYDAEILCEFEARR